MKLHNLFSRRRALFPGSVSFAGLAALLALELWIDHVAMQAASITTEIDDLLRYLQQTSTTVSDHQRLEERASRLHLTEGAATQAYTVMETAQTIATRNGLRLMLLRRETEASRRQPRSEPLARTLYNLIFEGRYGSELSALNDLATAGLVSRVQSVTFERIENRESSAGNVRMTLDLAVYRIAASSVGARPS